MQLKMQTDYAIRVLLYLASKDGYSATKEMSSALGISEHYLPKITKRLRKAGWISSYAGVTGGFQLTKEPVDITIYDVMNAMEHTVQLNRCLEDDRYCSRYAIDTCPVHKVYEVFQELTEQYFSSAAISDLLKLSEEDLYMNLFKSLNQFISSKLQTSGGSNDDTRQRR